jgi:hypothetical protein
MKAVVMPEPAGVGIETISDLIRNPGVAAPPSLQLKRNIPIWPREGMSRFLRTAVAVNALPALPEAVA